MTYSRAPEPEEPRAQQLELRDERGLLLRVLYERVAAVARDAEVTRPTREPRAD